MNLVGESMPGNNFPGYWSILAGYCYQIASGVPHDPAFRRSAVRDVDIAAQKCIDISAIVLADSSFTKHFTIAKTRGDQCSKQLQSLLDLETLTAAPPRIA